MALAMFCSLKSVLRTLSLLIFQGYFLRELISKKSEPQILFSVLSLSNTSLLVGIYTQTYFLKSLFHFFLKLVMDGLGLCTDLNYLHLLIL